VSFHFPESIEALPMQQHIYYAQAQQHRAKWTTRTKVRNQVLRSIQDNKGKYIVFVFLFSFFFKKREPPEDFKSHVGRWETLI
jgi:hypothetical protein